MWREEGRGGGFRVLDEEILRSAVEALTIRSMMAIVLRVFLRVAFGLRFVKTQNPAPLLLFFSNS